MLELCWDDISKVFGRISMLGLIVFQVLASSFWLRWWEISLCCFHPFGYDLGVVLYVVCHDFSHAYRCLDFSFDTITFMCGDVARASVWSVVIGLVC